MTPSKDDIKTWLKQHGRDRAWLAGMCYASKRTVDNWLSTSAPIPEDKHELIRRLMRDDATTAAHRDRLLAPANQIFSLEVTLQQFRNYSQAALMQSKTLEDWSIDALDTAAAALANPNTALDYRTLITPPSNTSTLNESPPNQED